MAPDRKWSIEQENFVVQQYLKEPRPSDKTVKRAFRLKFYPKNSRKLMDTRPADFKRIFERFQKNGIGRPLEKSVVEKRTANPSTSAIVKDMFDENPRKTIKEANQETQIPKVFQIIFREISTTWSGHISIPGFILNIVFYFIIYSNNHNNQSLGHLKPIN